jgi:hypothetical protein
MGVEVMISYIVAFDFGDDGNFLTAGDVVTARCVSARWELGMAAAGDFVGAPSVCEVLLEDIDATFPPEQGSGLDVGIPLRIYSNNGTERLHWSGFVAHIAPEGKKGRAMRVRGIGYEREYGQIVSITDGLDKRADELLGQVLDAARFRPAPLDDTLIIGWAGHDLIGTHEIYGSPPFSTDFDEGFATFAYAGDDWGEGIALGDALEQIVGSELGRFYFKRDGTARFLSRYEALSLGADDYTIAGTFSDFEYRYEPLLTACSIDYAARAVGTPLSVLATHDSALHLRPFEIRELRLNFVGAEGVRIGGLDVQPPVYGVDFTAYDALTGGNEVTGYKFVKWIRTEFSRIILRLHNETGSHIYVRDLQVRGTPVTIAERTTYTYSDKTSEMLYGRLEKALKISIFSRLSEIQEMAHFLVNHYKRSAGRLLWVKFDVRSVSGSTALAATLFSRILISDSHTGHSRQYYIVREVHEVTPQKHTVKWLLEPSDVGVFLIETSELDGLDVLGF